MEFLSKYYVQIRSHLGGLNTSQRIAIGLCVVLVMVGVMSLLQWSGKADRVSLMGAQGLSDDEMSRIVTQFQTTGVDYVQQGDRLMVPASERTKLYAMLGQQHALPANTSISFASLMQENNPFVSRDESRWRKETALAYELAKVVKAFDGVSDANVFLQIPQRRMIGSDGGKPSASVHVKFSGSSGLPKALVASIADFVSGAVEGLTPDAVKIIDTSGHSYRVPNAQDAMSFDVLDLRREREDHYTSKIREHLIFINGVLVGVNAELNLDRKQMSETKLGKPVISDEESITSSTTRGGGAVGPGVQPNIGKAVASGGGGESTSKEESHTKFAGDRDRTVTQTVSMPGDVRRLTASINVPRTYFAAIFKQRSGGKAEPKDSDLDPIIKSETAKIRMQVGPLIAAKEDNQIQVDWFYDNMMMVEGQPGSGPAQATMASVGPTDMTGMVKQYGPQAGLGLIAMFCLFSVMRMAKKAHVAITPPALTSAAAAKGGRSKRDAAADEDVNTLPGGESLAGEAMSNEAVLEGHEVGEDEVRIRHIIGQLSQMVNEDPNTAVSLVEQWVVGHR